MKKGIQYLSDLAVLELIHTDLNDECLDPNEIQHIPTLVTEVPTKHTTISSLVVVSWKDGLRQMMCELAGQVQQYK